MGRSFHRAKSLLVFREGQRSVSGRRLMDELVDELGALSSGACANASQRRAEAALLRAGELECVLADRAERHARGAKALATLTDHLADALVTGGNVGESPLARAELEAIDAPDLVSVSPPESFVYYGLHPSSFARLAEGLPIAPRDAAVIGIRSIGTTLSAVVAAALRRRGVRADRITVRPTGHPYDRMVGFAAEEIGWLQGHRARGARFFVVDEGPGFSGSSFLSVGDALVRAGVDPACVTFLCSRAPNLEELVAPDAARRWRAFAAHAVAPPAARPDGAGLDLSGGHWREHAYPEEALWPASWTMLERLKYLSCDGRQLFKFEGLGRWGAAARERAQQVAAAGFGPPVVDAGNGFLAYERIAGRPLAQADLSRSLLERLADYCAFRVAAFPAGDADGAGVMEMTRYNSTEVLGRALEPLLRVERPVIADARLMPHEWIQPVDGAALKVDAAAHGDDHFFPGPTDIAWDLAGVMVEWQLDEEARRDFLARYQRASGDHAERRLPAFLVAYLVYRAAYMKMAAGATPRVAETRRLLGEYRRYRRMLRSELQRHRG